MRDAGALAMRWHHTGTAAFLAWNCSRTRPAQNVISDAGVPDGRTG
jgi:hypothetical protein